MLKKNALASREQQLILALNRIKLGRSKIGERKISITAVAREAGVSPALIHNHYPDIAETIRNIQGRSSRSKQDLLKQALTKEQEKNRLLRDENAILRAKITDLATINEMLLLELEDHRSNANISRLPTAPANR
jgi:AcrR family transcriptional regulator